MGKRGIRNERREKNPKGVDRIAVGGRLIFVTHSAVAGGQMLG